MTKIKDRNGNSHLTVDRTATDAGDGVVIVLTEAPSTHWAGLVLDREGAAELRDALDGLVERRAGVERRQIPTRRTYSSHGTHERGNHGRRSHPDRRQS